MSESNMSELVGTYFWDEKGKSLGNADGIIPIPLYNGMKFTFHSHDGKFEVVEWKYHHGQPDEKAGLHIILRKVRAPELRSV